MAKNFIANPGAGGDKFASDEATAYGELTKIPISKLDIGADGISSPVNFENPLPAATTGAPMNYWPGYTAPTSDANKQQLFDEGGAAVVRAAALTDEGTFRANFANASIGSPIGNVTVSGSTVTGTGFRTSPAALKDYFKLDADGESAWTQILSMDSDTQITLVEDYLGAGSSGAASRAIVKPNTGAGGSITITNGQCTISSGTTDGAITGIIRKLDYCPIVYRAAASVSQRVANQTIFIGLWEDSPTPRWYSRFRLEGTNDSQVICETGRNPTGTPGTGEFEQITVGLPDLLTTNSSLELRVEQLAENVLFWAYNRANREADPILLAEMSRVIPLQHDIMACGVLIENGTGVASSTDVVCDYITGQNHNVLRVATFSEAEKIIATPGPIATFTGNKVGLGTVLSVDCSQFRQLSVTVSGTLTGTVTFEMSNDADFTTATTVSCTPSAGNLITATATTTTSPATFIAPVVLRYFRARISAGGTANRTVTINAFQQTSLVPKPIQTVLSGQAGHDAIVFGSPFRIAGRARAADYNAVASNDTADLVTTLVGALVTRQNAIPENDWSYAAASGGITNTTDVAVKAAAAAGIRNYVTGISLSNSSATATEFVIKDGASIVLWRCHLPAQAPNTSITFPTALRGSAATNVNVACITTGAAVYANLQGYIAP